MVRQHKLTEEDKEFIRQAHSEGMPYTALAARFNVSSATIMRVCRPELYEAQLVANRKYQAENIKKINAARKGTYRNYMISFHAANDAKVVEHMDKQDNVTDYVRQLVTNDMEKSDDQKKDSGSEG